MGSFISGHLQETHSNTGNLTLDTHRVRKAFQETNASSSQQTDDLPADNYNTYARSFRIRPSDWLQGVDSFHTLDTTPGEFPLRKFSRLTKLSFQDVMATDFYLFGVFFFQGWGAGGGSISRQGYKRDGDANSLRDKKKKNLEKN